NRHCASTIIAGRIFLARSLRNRRMIQVGRLRGARGCRGGEGLRISALNVPATQLFEESGRHKKIVPGTPAGVTAPNSSFIAYPPANGSIIVCWPSFQRNMTRGEPVSF